MHRRIPAAYKCRKNTVPRRPSSLTMAITESRSCPKPSFCLDQLPEKSGHIGFVSNFKILIKIFSVTSIAVQYQRQAEQSDFGFSRLAYLFFKTAIPKRNPISIITQYTHSETKFQQIIPALTLYNLLWYLCMLKTGCDPLDLISHQLVTRFLQGEKQFLHWTS